MCVKFDITVVVIRSCQIFLLYCLYVALAVCYCCTSGRTPFSHLDMLQKMRAITNRSHVIHIAKFVSFWWLHCKAVIFVGISPLRPYSSSLKYCRDPSSPHFFSNRALPGGRFTRPRLFIFSLRSSLRSVFVPIRASVWKAFNFSTNLNMSLGSKCSVWINQFAVYFQICFGTVFIPNTEPCCEHNSKRFGIESCKSSLSMYKYWYTDSILDPRKYCVFFNTSNITLPKILSIN